MLYTHSQTTNAGEKVSILISRSNKKEKKRETRKQISLNIEQETTLNLVSSLTQSLDASPRQRRQNDRCKYSGYLGPNCGLLGYTE
jgi:hypothetical protein